MQLILWLFLIHPQHHKDRTKISFYVAFISKRYQCNIEIEIRYSERRPVKLTKRYVTAGKCFFVQCLG
jgi:hypothetical protein